MKHRNKKHKIIARVLLWVTIAYITLFLLRYYLETWIGGILVD